MQRRFAQVDVFSAVPMMGNPVAVVLDADGLTDDQMQQLARWTNLSETTFVLPPTDSSADYRLRIFTPGRELPFAGHPTLGSAHAWLEHGGVPADGDRVVQECGAGLVGLRRDGQVLSFEAPPIVRGGPLEAVLLERVVAGLGVDPGVVLDSSWVDNGPGWLAVQLAAASDVLALEPDFAAIADLMVGVVAAHPHGGEHDFEVRAFPLAVGIEEDPVTGSLNASLAQWLIGEGVAPTSYRVRQGTCLGRAGDVEVVAEDDQTIWVGGRCTTLVRGTIDL